VKTGSPKRIPIIRESAIANDWLLSGPRREQLNGKIGRKADNLLTFHSTSLSNGALLFL